MYRAGEKEQDGRLFRGNAIKNILFIITIIFLAVDCSGTTSACDANCEETFTQVVAASGGGAACPASPAACIGGDCPGKKS